MHLRRSDIDCKITGTGGSSRPLLRKEVMVMLSSNDNERTKPVPDDHVPRRCLGLAEVRLDLDEYMKQTMELAMSYYKRFAGAETQPE